MTNQTELQEAVEFVSAMCDNPDYQARYRNRFKIILTALADAQKELKELNWLRETADQDSAQQRTKVAQLEQERDKANVELEIKGREMHDVIGLIRAFERNLSLANQRLAKVEKMFSCTDETTPNGNKDYWVSEYMSNVVLTGPAFIDAIDNFKA